MQLKDRWTQLCQAYTADEGMVAGFWQEIVSAYTSEARAYHNQEHLVHLAEEIMEIQPYLQDADAIWFALFYHDIVYSATAGDNEEKSARLAVERLSAMGLDHEKLQRVHSHILATKTHEAGADFDTCYLLDADLAILGASPVAYHDYTRKVRKEYSIYPGFMYKRGRRKVLKHFLQMSRIFKTDHFYQRYEKQARENLARELTSL
ncbi:hypothetical protein AB9P05_01695 [Roseivirga sp. BDSF3-8]|uniref:HD domain-containing protein n=1 Tax=Roseivirga sp. BDSF3-8 TaxID=3241598 RepID=UPI0035327832